MTGKIFIFGALVLGATLLPLPTSKLATVDLKTVKVSNSIPWATPSPTAAPVVVQIKTEAKSVQKTPQIQIAANKISPAPAVNEEVARKLGDNVWTPYNAQCQADCFPDLTADWMTKVQEYYKGSFETPGLNGTAEFKGLPGGGLDHYACEFMHVTGYLPGIEACKGTE